VQSINTMLLQRGVTFTVYAEAAGTERVFPFDIIPRILTKTEMGPDRAAIAQRPSAALNAFIHDVYHEERILHERRNPARAVYSQNFCRR